MFLAICSTIKGQPSSRKGKSAKSQRISYSEAQRLLANENEGNLGKTPNRFSSTRLSDGRVLEVYYPLLVKRVGRSKPTSVAGSIIRAPA
jgi:hypothetical protein